MNPLYIKPPPARGCSWALVRGTERTVLNQLAALHLAVIYRIPIGEEGAPGEIAAGPMTPIETVACSAIPKLSRKARRMIIDLGKELMTDDELLRYFEAHSQIPGALFSKAHIERLLELADQPRPSLPLFMAVHEDIACHLVALARERRETRRSLPPTPPRGAPKLRLILGEKQ